MLRYLDLSHFLFVLSPSLTQRVFQKFMDSGSFTKHLNKMRTLYGRKRDHLISELERNDFPVSFLERRQVFIFICVFTQRQKKGTPLKKQHKMTAKVYGMTDYYYNQNNPNNSTELLLGYGNLSEEEITRGIQRLKKAWKDIL